MVKLINEDASQEFLKILSNTSLSDSQVATVRRGQKMYQALTKLNLKCNPQVSDNGEVKLLIPIGNNSGVTLLVSNTDQHVNIVGADNLPITEDTVKQFMNIIKVTSSM